MEKFLWKVNCNLEKEKMLSKKLKKFITLKYRLIRINIQDKKNFQKMKNSHFSLMFMWYY